jgi:hypothetical protein
METGNLIIDAQTAFTRARRQRRRERVIAWLRRAGAEPLAVACLERAAGAAAATGVVGVRAIPLDSIVGTVEGAKARGFDRRFRPPRTSRRRWERLWIATRRGAPVPPISVYRIGNRHFVNDGHHRVSVAHALDQAAIDAEVIDMGSPRPRWDGPCVGL